jgi:mannose-6-phosphate isomerase-like protein (cupin superfamily)
MPDYAVKNLLEIDPAGNQPGYAGRFARKFLDSRDLGVSLFTYEAGVRSSMAHSHKEQEEAYVVVEGSGRAWLDGDIVDLSRWDVVRVGPPVMRAFEAGPDGMTVIAIGGPKPAEGDGVRGGDVWGDEAVGGG